MLSSLTVPHIMFELQHIHTAPPARAVALGSVDVTLPQVQAPAQAKHTPRAQVAMVISMQGQRICTARLPCLMLLHMR